MYLWCFRINRLIWHIIINPRVHRSCLSLRSDLVKSCRMICYSLVVHGPSILADFLYATTSGWSVVPLFFSCCFCCVKGFSVMMQQWYYCTMKPIISSGFHYKTFPLHRAKRTYTAVKVHLFWTIIYPCCDKHPRDRQKPSIQSGKDNKIWVCHSEFPELTPILYLYLSWKQVAM